ncbi:uncharacterized protein L3040_000620 [Drepanopeziza brunnea f. sp. 'multigermtubi']|uniref:Uncharacterized protein n=1 Tax=Marssonina brunnea f. sp. multigermtubi (strain MB_m1) TaxID=1072389 RepID=K1XL83_MARBU|nr:uncharacterized protein MBM_00456 [Drepanopeziza brunnea f. sp. 'multigermtubi' MB_m1]EKD21343.1 hypothetical protein MBM_00456 [Drepanopeziza brunnea f. sp. 'multigermtubi' MB_m1]KAJ5054344.1 hypothetical protein L3040_000620 [Drepanopeziza brunnea f. sp. 'multigermtubi']
MARLPGFLALFVLAQSVLSSQFRIPRNTSSNSTTYSSATVHWLEGKPLHNFGTTFGLPWPQGKYFAENTSFTAETDLQSWITGYWKDGSIKWTGHAIPASDSISETYTVTAEASEPSVSNSNMVVTNEATKITVNTGKLTVVFPKDGNTIIEKIQTASGKIIGQDGRLVLQSQSAALASNSSNEFFNFVSSIDAISVSEESSVRTLITVNGTHKVTDGGSHVNWLPFVLRFYLYANSESVRLLHSLVFDGNAEGDFVTGIGIRFNVPLSDALYDRHVRLAGVDGGLLSEAVQGITGLRRDPGATVRNAQFEGQALADPSTWDLRVTNRTRWIPQWGDYRLSQLSSDGFNLKKRTKEGQTWLKISAGTRSGGLAYLGGATAGGLALGLRDFWKRYPTGLEIANAASDVGEMTLWIYDPMSEPLDLRPYHDGLNQTGYVDQLDALEITYEDHEPGFDTPYGISRTSEVYLFGFEETPARDTLSSLVEYISDPPFLVAKPEHLFESKGLGLYWGLPDTSSTESAAIEQHLDFLFNFYEGQVDQRSWYGFLDYGDFMHAYDLDRHQWRYDIGGYAWDNSELSPDLFFWLYFIRTGRADVYRFAEAMTRHTGEVDVYHLGRWKGLGTRHGVQHFGDSAKQARIAQPQYRKYFYYLSGGDERVGELLDELADTDKTYGYLDPNRKVRTDGWVPTPGATVAVGLGTDLGALAAGWLIAWERRAVGWEDARAKITNVFTDIAALKNGFVTGSGQYNLTNWRLSPPPLDPNNDGLVSVSHLSSVFGLPEVLSEAEQFFGDDLPAGFRDVWIDYCYYYTAADAEKRARYGATWTPSLIQGHSRLKAYVAHVRGNVTTAKRAWKDFHSDGLLPTSPWSTVLVNGSASLKTVDEAAWLATNDMAQYGLAAIQNLALIPDSLTTWNS